MISTGQIAALIEREPIVPLPERLCPVTKGEFAWPPAVTFRAMVLAVWYDLSDMTLEDVAVQLPRFLPQ